MLIRKGVLVGAAGVLTVAGLVGPARAISFVADAPAAAPSTAAVTGAPVTEQPTVKLVDARDLVSVIPASPNRNPTMAVTDLVLGMGRSLNLRTEPLADGVFTVSGEENVQNQFVQLLEQVRELYRGQYELELACYSIPAATPPDIGAAATVDGAPVRLRQAVTRRVETKLEASKTVTMIVKWQPVVADNSVGYDAQMESVVVGLQAWVLVGAGADSTDGSAFSIDVRIRGEISDVQMKELSVPLMGESKGGLPVQLATVSKRSISADTRVGAQPRVVGVVPGLKEGELLVIAASVKPVKK